MTEIINPKWEIIHGDALKVLEGYAQTYAREHTGEGAVGLVINYVRCGVEKYTGGSWTMLAGERRPTLPST